ncbi:MAG TPA: PP2C family protein-serine/threonine phosphatase [Myxococcaceae bacterium]|jgi:serine phosphatase RsbU (regulator of sigma subunit)
MPPESSPPPRLLKRSLKHRWTFAISGMLVAGLAAQILMTGGFSFFGTWRAAVEWLRFSEKQASGMQEAHAVKMFQRLGTALVRNPVVEAGTREPGPERLRQEIEPVLGDSGVRWAYLGKAGQVWGSEGGPECTQLATGWESVAGPDPVRWVECGKDVVLAWAKPLGEGQLVLWRPVDAQYLGEHQALADNELILWAPGQPLVSTLRRPDGGPAEVKLPAELEKALASTSATESPCSTYVLTVRGYVGYRGKYGKGEGWVKVPSYVCFSPIRPATAQMHHRVLYVIPRAVVDASAWYGVWTMVAIAALVLVPALVWLAWWLVGSATRPVLALSKASTRVAQGEFEVVVNEQAEGELAQLIDSFNAMTRGLREGQAALVESERRAAVAPLLKEMEIAHSIQRSILPAPRQIPAYDIAARMVPVAAMGGDYYDVRPTADGGCWIGIGDVAGHGVTSGLVMLMVQSGISALLEHKPDMAPHEVLSAVNTFLHDNIRERLRSDEHITLSLLRFHPDGRVEMAGAHEDVLVRRVNGSLDRLETSGTWLGAIRDVGPFTRTSAFQLNRGDLLLLHTDGATEAPNPGRERLGLDRIATELQRKAEAPTTEIRDALFELVLRWSPQPEDDVTLLVVRYLGEAQRAAA